jgi:hypothetical protein
MALPATPRYYLSTLLRHQMLQRKSYSKSFYGLPNVRNPGCRGAHRLRQAIFNGLPRVFAARIDAQVPHFRDGPFGQTLRSANIWTAHPDRPVSCEEIKTPPRGVFFASYSLSLSKRVCPARRWSRCAARWQDPALATSALGSPYRIRLVCASIRDHRRRDSR